LCDYWSLWLIVATTNIVDSKILGKLKLETILSLTIVLIKKELFNIIIDSDLKILYFIKQIDES